MEVIYNLCAFIISLGVLVSVHEYGHYIVAKWCKVKVLRFSIGFGKPLWRRLNSDGTEFVIASIPLGGYVKMLDERELTVSDNELHLAFNRKPVLSRMAIVAAGPIANFLLAIIMLWGMYSLGITVVIPKIGHVLNGSVAANSGLRSGDEIVAINNQKVFSWRDVAIKMLPFIGEDDTVLFSVRRQEVGRVDQDQNKQSMMKHVITLPIVLSHWMMKNENNDIDSIRALGLIPYVPTLIPIIGLIVANGVADQAGLKVGDKIIQVNNKYVHSWKQFVYMVRAAPNKMIKVSVVRRGESLVLPMYPAEKKEQNNHLIGYIGVSVAQQSLQWPSELLYNVRYNPIIALWRGIHETGSLISVTSISLWKMLTGLVSLKNLSGPITIAKVAGSSIQEGISSFLYFLGMISVSLGVLNLLPIPVLDGGHLFFYIIEWVKGTPLSEKAQLLGLKLGATLVLAIMIMAIYNDISHIFS